MNVATAPQVFATAEMHGLVGVATRIIRALGEWGVGFLTFVETVVPPLPSEVILPLAGFIARQGEMSFALLLLTSTIGAWVGALALYALAARLGQDRAIDVLAKIPLLDRRDFVRSTNWFKRHGKRSVFIGRLVPGVRALVSLPAGAVRMPLVRFSLLTIVGSALWNALLIGLGWVLGSRYELVDQYSSVLDWAAVIAVVAFVGWLVLRRVRRVRRARADRVAVAEEA